ncbi:serine hydrolase domain-containing protein, partial [Calditrichota bacterium]
MKVFLSFIVFMLITNSQAQLLNTLIEEKDNLYNVLFNSSKSATLDSIELDLFIKTSMNNNHIPGLATAIVKNNKIIWNNCYGFRDIQNNLNVNDTTAFLLASVSKTITATALMQLWEQGLFQLDDDINNYLPTDILVVNPWYPNEPITFRQLLTH